MHVRGLVIMVTLLAALLLPAAGGGAVAPPPRPGGRVVVALTAGWDLLDPAVAAFTFAREIMGNIFDPLLIRDPDTGEIRPGVASSYTVSPDGRVILLKLRQGVRFHDGTPLNAEAVAFSINRIKDPALRSPFAATILGPVERVETPDPFTVQITLSTPFAPFLDALTEIGLAPVSPTAVRRFGANFGQNPVGTGPFIVKEIVPNQRVTLVRNPDYRWAPRFFRHPGPAYLDELVYTVVPEDATRLAQLVRGEVQVLYNAPPREVARLGRNPNFRAFFKNQSGLPRVIVLNTSRWPFDDLRVRQAVAHAINKDELLRAVYENVGAVANAPLSPATWGYNKAVEQLAQPYSPDRARQLLAEAGWRPGPDGIVVKDGRPFRIRLGTITVAQQLLDAQVKQAQLRQVGIDAQIVAIEQAPYLAGIRRGEWEMAGMLFVSADPDVLFIVGHSSQIERGWNTAIYRNAELDRLLEEGRVTMDPRRRFEIYTRAQEHLMRNVPYIPFYVIRRAFLTTGNLNGYVLDARAFQLFHNAWLARR
ncbi:MAG: ABC transporter substrate-binding protein [Armatimonadota bacterium]|nr:ABC transporter substrate-binding protein [Armatimonadota bacterium]MDR7463338.1 ABC transporter substrate-binding protein [Armatimonadota bacterium]MDR7469152.1 ABC transporter substrate-binding protein [Armatimonadota bacterium]MDR7474577.1 ABC transporter substrate-binding protein [Armatimonadota bacterium]MDR7538721.1 ABC transporter substrate-binding protein [Armatimonadota bacterium]